VPTFKITLAYDGTNYVGWQRQAAGSSIQGLVEDALGVLDGRSVDVAGAGRTDAGVHALGQVASFTLARDIEPEVLLRALNAHLPDDVRVIRVESASSEFHARFDARRKTYRYRICDGPAMSPFDRLYAWHLPGALDTDAMDDAAHMLEGRHDFAAFQTAGGATRTTERTVERSSVHRDTASIVAYEISGEGFLRHMVRAIAGTLVEIGRGRATSASMRDVLASRDRSKAGSTAPAKGLFLVSVEYGDDL
jgi:tRNA pseudouridine38-40 synthase